MKTRNGIVKTVVRLSMKLAALFSATLMVLGLICGSASAIDHGPIIAQTGFNDQSGINSNPTLDSPYKLNNTVQGYGTIEPGWGGSTWWTYPSPGRGVAENNYPYEGDGSLHMTGTSQSGTPSYLSRAWGQPQYFPFVLEQEVRAPANGWMFSLYRSSQPNQPYMTTGPIWYIIDNTFRVADGDGQGNWVVKDTGFASKPMQWQKVSMLIDPLTQTYDFYVDDVKYNPVTRLRFAGAPTNIVTVDYETHTDIWFDALTVAQVPEPSTLVLLGIGALGLLAYAWRRQKRAA